MPERNQEALRPIVEALAALDGLGIEQQTLLDAMVRQDDAALDKVNKAIAASGNKDTILEKMRHATELMQAAIGDMSDKAVDSIIGEVQRELVALEEPQVQADVQEPLKLYEDKVAIAQEQVVHQAAAIDALTLTEQSPAVEHGAPIQGLTAFDLMRVNGSDAESINAYLAEQARALGKRDVTELSAEEFQKVTVDTKSFHHWSAERWVDTLVAERKEAARVMAKGKTDPVRHRGGRVGPGWTSDPVKEHILGKPVQEKLKQQTSVGRELDEFERTQQRSLAEDSQTLADQHAIMLASYEESLRGQGIKDDVVARLLDQQRTLYEQTRTAIQAEKQTALQAEVQARRLVLEQRKQELSDLEKNAAYTVTVGIKREMVLSVDRWGKALQQVVTEYPNFVQRDEQTGQITLDIDAVRNDPAALKILVDQIGKEIQRVTAANKSAGETSLRANNLEAIITSPMEAELAELYLQKLLKEVNDARSRFYRGGAYMSYRNDLLQQHDDVWKFLNDKKLASVEHELQALEVYKAADRELPSALPALVEQYKAALDVSKSDTMFYDFPIRVAKLVEKLCEERVTKAEGNKLLSPGFIEGLASLAELIGNKRIVSDRNSRRALGAMLTTLGDWRGGNIDPMKRKIYEAATANKHILWSDREYYAKAEIIISDFAGRHDELTSWTQDSLSDAAFGQIEFNAQDWAKTNRAEARVWLDRVAATVQTKFEERMEYSNRSHTSSVDPAQAVTSWQEKADKMQAIVKAMGIRMAKLAKLKAEL